ncbi:MAG TPA: Fe-S cluster assembly protein SufD [Casimicrobiaceae bacterium]|nr:Fe-S cluster assembly protein SufD [Casimicrobiaceae bacterium]
MTTTHPAPAAGYLESLLAGRPMLPASAHASLNALRAEAVDRVGALTVPTVRDEEWRFTDLSPLTRQTFQPVRERVVREVADAGRFDLGEAASRLVFVDGVYAPELSRITANGPVVANLATADAAQGDLAARHLGRYAVFRDNVFAALNTAFVHDGALIFVPPASAAAVPVHLLFVARTKGAASYPRCLVVAGRASAATVVEDYVSLTDGPYFTDAVTEIALAEDASIDHVRVQREGGQAFHIGSGAVSLATGSRFRSVSVALGARLSRYNLAVEQAAEGASCTVDGLAVIGGRQLADTHTSIAHRKPRGVSRQLHKCIVGGAAHAVFNGKIYVHPHAQKTDSSQSSRNLLLGDRAQVDTKPQLEIFADDVKCAHGATVGRLDADALFYLRSRGLGDAAARSLLTYAFGAEIVDRIPLPSLRRQLEATLLAQTQLP